MVRIKVFKASQLLYWAVIIIVAVALIGLIASALLGGGGDAQPETRSAPESTTQETVPLPETGRSSTSRGGVDRQAAIETALSASTSTLGQMNAGEDAGLHLAPAAASGGSFFSVLSKWFFSVDLLDPVSVLNFHLPVEATAVSSSIVQTGDGDITGDDELPGESDAGEHIRVEIARITEPYRPASRGKVLIYHTHTYEAYEQNDSDPYVEASAQWRTKEEDKSIVGVGNLLAEELSAMGYEVVHDKTEFEPPKLGTSYVRSLEMLDRRKAAGEEYALVIDLHRDAWDTVQGKRMTSSTEYGNAARLMMLIGTGEGSEGNTFSIKPNWQENYKLADALTQALNGIAPGICRDILVKTGRYNQHVYEHSVLIEVGNNKNMLEEAQNSIPVLAQAIDAILSETEE